MGASEFPHALVIPGCASPDFLMKPLRTRLKKEGIQPHSWRDDDSAYSPLGMQAYFEYTLERLEDLTNQLGEPVTIVGHSFGGLLGRLLGNMMPNHVSKLITLGSPMSIGNRNPLIDLLFFPVLGDRVDEIRNSMQVPTHSLYSINDLIIPTYLAIGNENRDPNLTNESLGISYGHTGLIFGKRPAERVAEIIHQD